MEMRLECAIVIFTFTFRAFGRCFYPKPLTKSTIVEGDSNIC